MFDTLFVALAVSIVLFVAYLIVRAYKPEWFGEKVPLYKEPFSGGPVGPPVLTQLNTPAPPIPAPAPPVKQDPPEEPRVVAPGGPNPPNAAPPADAAATISPEAKPLDPYEDRNMDAPIQDSMRHPEMSFGPGVDNSGMNRLATSGVASAKASASETSFSPDFAQNGGGFMGSVFANDLQKGDAWAQA